MPIRFFCEHCKQMLKIGTSKVGSVVECPRCKKSVVVPLQSNPQAEEWYQSTKNKPPNVPPVPDEKQSEHAGQIAAPVPTEANREEEADDINMPLWMEETWMPSSTDMSSIFPTPAVNPSLVDEMAILALKKRHKLTVMILNFSLIVAFFVGIVFGIFIRDLIFTQPTDAQRAAGNHAAAANEVSGTIYFLNDDGERRADVEAVIICLPKDRKPSALLSCKGLLPADAVNNDTIQMFREWGGIYTKADANGGFTFAHKASERYLVLLISANQSGTGEEISLNVLTELRRYFRDPELFGENSFHIDEYEWADGKHSLRYTFEPTE